MAAGYLGLTLPGTTTMYASLGLVIIGNGFFKPNISTLLGNIYNREDLKPLNIYESLSRIYKLNYLSGFLDSSSFENENTVTEIWKLCGNCLGLFTNLQQFYEDFNQLRSLEFKLAIEIQKLDDCIQHQKQKKQAQPHKSKKSFKLIVNSTSTATKTSKDTKRKGNESPFNL